MGKNIFSSVLLLKRKTGLDSTYMHGENRQHYFLKSQASKVVIINPNRCGIFGLLIMRGGWIPPYEKQSIAEATIFNLHQQSACHMKGVMFSVHLIPW